MNAINLILCISLLSIMVKRAFLQTTQAPFIHPRFLYNHYYTTMGPNPITIVVSTNSVQSPDYLRLVIDYKLELADSKTYPLERDSQHHFFKTYKPCQTSLKISTKKQKFTLLILSIKLYLGWESQLFAHFPYKIDDQFQFGTLQIYDTFQTAGLGVQISNDDEEFLQVSPEKTPKEVLEFLKNLIANHNAICAVTNTNKAVVVRTSSDSMLQTSSYVSGLKGTYTTGGALREGTIPAYLCTTEQENQDILVVTDKDVTMEQISFSASVTSFRTHKRDTVALGFRNADLRQIDKLDNNGDLEKVLFIFSGYRVKRCKGDTEIKSYLMADRKPYIAYRSGYLRIKDGVRGFFWHLHPLLKLLDCDA